MPTAIVLDTSVLPQHGVLHSPPVSALLRIAHTRGMDVILPDLVIDESVNGRREGTAAAQQKLRSALSDASRYFEPNAIYLPDPADVANEWRTGLATNFKVVATRPEDAHEAIRREALRIPPAGKGRGARDSLIWLTTLRIARESQSDTYFVSQNTGDFGAPDLRPELAAEIGSSSPRLALSYFTTLEACLSTLAEELSYNASTQDIMALEDSFTAALMESGYLESDDVIGSTGGLIVESISLDVCEDVSALRAYRVEDKLLVLVKVKAIFRAIDIGAVIFFGFDGRCWLRLNESDNSIDEFSIASARVSPLDIQSPA